MTISLHACRFFAHHGVMPQELRAGNEFEVDLQVTYIPVNPLSDDLAGTISYADLYEIVRIEMQQPRQLLETVAASIAGRIRQLYPMVTSGAVSITKLTPPIRSFTGTATVTYKF